MDFVIATVMLNQVWIYSDKVSQSYNNMESYNYVTCYFPVWLLGMRTFFMQIYFAQVPHIFYSVNSECFLSPIIKGVSIPTTNRVHWQETEDKKNILLKLLQAAFKLTFIVLPSKSSLDAVTTLCKLILLPWPLKACLQPT